MKFENVKKISIKLCHIRYRNIHAAQDMYVKGVHLDRKLLKQIGAVCAGAAFLYIVLMMDGKEKVIEGGRISRPDYAESETDVGIKAYVEGQGTVEAEDLKVYPREYTSQQIEGVYDEIYESLAGIICGDNENLSSVSGNLNLITELEGYPVTIEWYSSDYSLVDYQGNVHTENIGKDKKEQTVQLEAVLTYGDFRGNRKYDVTVIREELKGEAGLKKAVSSELIEAEEQERDQENVELPQQINGKAVTYTYRRRATAPWLAVILGIVGIAAVFVNEKHKKQQEKEQRKAQLRYDYSEVVSKLTLLIGAGMTIRMAWYRIVEDYKKTSIEKRYVYEEMAETKKQLESGRSEHNVYEKFGRRCDTKEYLKLGALLEQNIRKGTRDIITMLEQEAEDAFEEHKNMAVKKGEEAGTKLLIPMIIMLVIVMVIVMVPAVMSFDL